MSPGPGRKQADQAALFDSIAGNYEEILADTVRGTGFPPSYFQEYKPREVRRFLNRLHPPLEPETFLVFGCGPGLSEPWVRKYFPKARIFAVDVSKKSVESARGRNRGLKGVEYGVIEGEALPFIGPFDVVFAANVFHHVTPQARRGILELLRETLSAEGYLFLFEHNPWNPFTRRAVARCPMDEGVNLLAPSYTRRLLKEAGFEDVRIRFTLFVPGTLRFLLFLEPYLAPLPLGGQYFAAAKKR